MRFGMIAVTLLLTTSLQVPAKKNSELERAIDRYLSIFHQNKDFSGVVAISRKGELLASRSFGSVDLASGRRPSASDTFHIASISKTFTAAAIRKLSEEGKVDLDAPLSLHLPHFPEARRITIRQLLTHRSGVPDYWALEGADAKSKEPIELNQLLAWLAEQPLDFDPGSESRYSNSGYALLAAVVERVSGQSFHRFLTREILGPAQLSATGQYRRDSDTVGHQPAFGSTGIKPHAPYDPAILVGAGSLKSSANDLLAWCKSFIDDFNDPDTPPFIYGWGGRESNGRRWVEQTGRNPGFASHIRAYPAEELCVVVLNNIESDSVATIGAGLADLALGGEATHPLSRRTVEMEVKRRQDYVGTFQIAPNHFVEVKDGTHGLMLRGRNGPFLPLEWLGGELFFYRQLHVEVVARRNGTGLVDALLWGGSYPMPRIAPPADLREE